MQVLISVVSSALQAVTLTDVNHTAGESALAEIEKEFGANKAIYVHADASNKDQFEGISTLG